MLLAPHRPPGFGGISNFLGMFLHVAIFMLFFTITVALIFLLVRFLLVATKAAHLYIAKNAPAPAPPLAPSSAAQSSTAPAATKATTSTRPRAPKPPAKS